MGASSGFPIDLILFGMIAAFLVLRLRSILGRRTGFERQAPPPQPVGQQPATGPVIDGHAEPPPATATRTVPAPASEIGQALQRMQSVDRTFDPAKFLDGAEKAFRIIVAAFATPLAKPSSARSIRCTARPSRPRTFAVRLPLSP
jgi:predicted lipid-binding transport protein (Tim44 family)